MDLCQCYIKYYNPNIKANSIFATLSDFFNLDQAVGPTEKFNFIKICIPATNTVLYDSGSELGVREEESLEIREIYFIHRQIWNN